MQPPSNDEVLVVPELKTEETGVVSIDATAPLSRKQKVLSTKTALRIISKAVRDGEVSREQARELRNRMGVAQSFFTKKVSDKDKAKVKKKTAEASRKRNRGQGKGHKRSSGKLGKYT